MRLTDLKPKWMRRPDGEAVAIIFLCPRCVERGNGCDGKGRAWLTCTFKELGNREQRELLERTLAQHQDDFAGVRIEDVVACKQHRWERDCKMLDRITITPSIDASASGHWHGHVVRGEISGTAAPAVKRAKTEIRCFFLEPVEPVRTRRWLRRYSHAKCTGPYSYHNAELLIGDIDGKVDEERDAPPADETRWPEKCTCGYVFTGDDARQLFTEHLFRRADTGEVTTLREAPAGAMWFAPWFGDYPAYRGPDGKTLVVRLPPDGHDWIVDSRASNCTLPKDDVHKCWIRHGTPPNITVDKRGVTCSAGAGSIKTPKWHGFLQNGVLRGS